MCSKKDSLSFIPSVDEVLRGINCKGLKKEYVVELVRECINDIRHEIAETEVCANSRDEVLEIVKERVQKEIGHLTEGFCKKVVNATGILLHTGLGRAPFGRKLRDVINVIKGYSSLEFDLITGKRGDRLEITDRLLRLLTGAEASAVVNNNAGAVLLALNTIAEGKEVVVSRGELIEIGGAFRLPEVIRKSGVRLVEVGTTNRTYLEDYRNAIGENTGAILVAHTSNYRIVGFVHKPAIEKVVELARGNNVPVIVDIGSGALFDMEEVGLPHEPVVRDFVKKGVDIVTFSGDKLLGGPQSGIIVGKKRFINKVRKNPLMRALRCDKFTLFMLFFTLKEYIKAQKYPGIELYELFMRPLETLKKNALNIIEGVEKTGCKIRVVDSFVEAGSGSMPTERIPSVAIEIACSEYREEEIARKFREFDPPIVGYIKNGRFYLDLKAVLDDEFEILKKALREIVLNR